MKIFRILVDGHTFDCEMKQNYTQEEYENLREIAVEGAWLSMQTLNGDTLILNKAAIQRSIFIIVKDYSKEEGSKS